MDAIHHVLFTASCNRQILTYNIMCCAQQFHIVIIDMLSTINTHACNPQWEADITSVQFMSLNCHFKIKILRVFADIVNPCTVCQTYQFFIRSWWYSAKYALIGHMSVAVMLEHHIFSYESGGIEFPTPSISILSLF